MASDFHTHDPDPAHRALISSTAPLPGKLTSLEVHPWHLPETFSPDLLRRAEELLDQFAALGEIGLDRMRGPSLPVQEQYLHRLLALAADAGKPVVIHAVRTLPEVLAVTAKYPVRVMIHGFRSSAELLDELWKREITVSFHPSATDRPALMGRLKHAAGRFGFESDDRKISLPELLARAAEKSGIKDMEQLTDQHFADFLEK